MTLTEFIDSTVEGDDPTARLRAIKVLKAAVEDQWIEEGSRLSKLKTMPWSRIGASVGMSARLASYYFGDEASRTAWRRRNSESQALLRASLKKVA